MRAALFFLLLGISWISFGQKTKRVTGTYKLQIESHMSEAQAKQMAVEQAKIEAMKNEFGTRISAMNQTRMETANGSTNTNFTSISNSLVKGVWLENLAPPKFEMFNVGDERWVSVEVAGKARNLDKSEVNFEAKPLDCPNANCDSQEFEHRGDLFFYFRSPVDGHLSIYLDDRSYTAMLLPYRNMKGSTVKIEADKEYIFFNPSPESNYFGNLGDVEQYVLETPYQYEIDLIYVLFSPEEYTKPILQNSGGIKYTESEEFSRWLGNIMSYENMYLEVIDVSISK